MFKDYTIKNTTKEERRKIINDALAISILNAREPSAETKQLVEKYVNGEMEIPEILEMVIKRYRSG